MKKLILFVFALACFFLGSSDAHTDMCVALNKGEKGYADKISTLKKVASISYSASEQTKLKEQIDQIRDMCSYKIFIELLKKSREWEPYVFSSALDVKNTDAQGSFIELITKHAGKWQAATYRSASRIDSEDKAKLFKKMLTQAVRVDFPAIAYDVLADLNNEAQVEAFSSILQKKTSFNWKDAVFQAVKSLKVTKPLPNYPLLAFKAMLYAAPKKDWSAETYTQLESLHANAAYLRFLRKNSLESAAREVGRLNVENPFDTFFDQQSLEALIKDNNIGSIEALLPMLPTWLRSNYTLMFYSRSNQEANFQKPRAIMFTPLVDFIAAFNDRSMKGGDTLETISVNKQTFEFEFREVVFKNGRAQFSAINPPKCAVCHHGNDLKPNWPEYNFWMGAYGMFDDQINSAVLSREGSLINSFEPPQEKKDTEAMLTKIGGMPGLKNTFEEFKKFRATKDRHARYQYLGPDSDAKYAPYNYRFGDIRVENGRIPNTLLNLYISTWNIMRIFLKVKNAPGYEKTRMSLLYFLAKCDSQFNKEKETLVANFQSTGVVKSSRYDELFQKELGIDYLKMTDLTFGRDLMLLHDVAELDRRMAYLLAADYKDSVPEIAGHTKIDTNAERDPLVTGLTKIAPRLLLPSFFKWEGCAVLEKAMKKGQ